MKYRIGQLEHDCEPSAKAGVFVYWKVGKWWEHEGEAHRVIKEKKPKCRFCKKSLYDPTVCNYISTEIVTRQSLATGLKFDYTAIFIQKADRRKKEFK